MTADKKGIKGKQFTEEDKAIIYDGASVSQLGLIFEMDNRRVSERLAEAKLKPSGDRLGFPIYKIVDAAPFLLQQKISETNFEETIKKMSPKDIPVALNKEYWAGQQNRLKFMEMQGDLWPTGRVIEMFAEAVKTMKMTIQLMLDRVERATELTDKQRDLIRRMTDGLLTDLSKALIERFENEPKRTINSDGTIGYQNNDAEDEEL